MLQFPNPSSQVFGKRHFGLGYGQEPFLRAGCRVNTCMTTANRKLFKMKDIDALIWHFRSDDRSLPPIRYPHIYYVFYMMESASYTYGDLKRFKNIFNLVFTYRQDSDFYNPYGYIYRRRLPLPIEDFQNIAASKTKLAAWFVSHCETVGKRE
ncbi:Alpha-(1,3)-fucosyltransferase 7, partial [Halocaridina rubra]